MPLSFTCPHCGHQTEVAEQYAGQSGPCVQCGKPVTVPLGGPAGTAPRRPQTGSGCFLAMIVLGVLGAFLLVLTVVAFVSLPLVFDSQPMAHRSICQNNLRQIAMAMHNYHAVHGTFPPAYVADQNGRPMHSWRTLLLPYLERDDLYRRYNFDEPWNSPANQEVTNQSLDVFRCPEGGSTPDSSGTNYVMLVGPNTLSNGASSTSIRQITDGTSNTIMLVEVSDSSINWAEPRDLAADAISFEIDDPRAPGISSGHPGGAHCALCDGSVHFLSQGISPRLLQEMSTIDGGEAVDPTKLNP